ncbi:MAG TPA: hypothetical protein VLA51_01575, partial [Paracoccaceae bacterium]|nr:hypothetical protein [Paracoccaceae bacterium]
LGIARDAAFGFYYPDDLDALEDAGCDLVPINMISDAKLPDIDALFIGGGFPETQMEALGANQTMRESVRQAIKDGLPVYAECGGLMYLCRTLRWGDKVAPMVGAIEADAVMHEKPQGRGYVAFYPNPAHLWGAEFMTRKAHEFHYASIEGLPDTTVYARDVQRGHGIDGKHDGIVVHNTVAGFTHLRNTWPSPWVSRWVDFIRRVKATKNPA